ncbi:Bromodomain [Trinorchestia longiramus]|nr:Bromodomain [Trinorchestia longiramus]
MRCSHLDKSYKLEFWSQLEHMIYISSADSIDVCRYPALTVLMCADIQSWWELPSVAHFCSLFRAAFDLLHFDIEELEEAILCDGVDGGGVEEGNGGGLVVELVVRLLQGCLPHVVVAPHTVNEHLMNIFRQKCQLDPSRENLFTTGSRLQRLGLRHKVQLLHALCDFRLEADDVLELLKNLESDSLRVEPLGYDNAGCTYWYFYGTRLYREDHSLYHPHRRRPKDKDKTLLLSLHDKRKKKRKKKGSKDDSDEEDDDDQPRPVWQVQCYTEADWSSLAERFEGCESRLERSLLQTLRDDFLPEIPRLFQEKEKLQRKKMLEIAPRRMSGRVQKLKEKRVELQPGDQESQRQSQEVKTSQHFTEGPSDEGTEGVEAINRQLDERLRGKLVDGGMESSRVEIKREVPDYDEVQEHDPDAECDSSRLPLSSSAVVSAPSSLPQLLLNATNLISSTASQVQPPSPIHPPPLSSTLRLSSSVIDEYDIDNVELDRVQNFKHSYVSSKSYLKCSDLSYRRSSTSSSVEGQNEETKKETSPPVSPKGVSSCSVNEKTSKSTSNKSINNNNNNTSKSRCSSNSRYYKKECDSGGTHEVDDPEEYEGEELYRPTDSKADEHEGKKRKRRHSSASTKTDPKSKKRKPTNSLENYRKKKKKDEFTVYEDETRRCDRLDDDIEEEEEEEEEEEVYRPRPGRRRSSFRDQELAIAASLAEHEKELEKQRLEALQDKESSLQGDVLTKSEEAIGPPIMNNVPLNKSIDVPSCKLRDISASQPNDILSNEHEDILSEDLDDGSKLRNVPPSKPRGRPRNKSVSKTPKKNVVEDSSVNSIRDVNSVIQTSLNSVPDGIESPITILDSDDASMTTEKQSPTKGLNGVTAKKPHRSISTDSDILPDLENAEFYCPNNVDKSQSDSGVGDGSPRGSSSSLPTESLKMNDCALNPDEGVQSCDDGSPSSVTEPTPFLSPSSSSMSKSSSTKSSKMSPAEDESPRPSPQTPKAAKKNKRGATKSSNISSMKNKTQPTKSSTKKMKKKKKANNDSSEDEDDRRTDTILSGSGTLNKPQVYSGRKTNNSLSSLAFSLSPAAAAVVPEPTEPPPPSTLPIKKKVKTSHVVLQTDEDLRTGMYKVLEHLRNHADAWAFLDPVEESIAPNYYAVIRRPMHITKLEDRLDKGYYASLAMFDADFKLMMDNCKLYNGPESEYTHMAYTLEKVFAKLRAKYLETDMSSDEEIYIDMSYQQNSTSKKRRRSINSDEKENNKGFKAPGKRGRKKKVGRKPKDQKLSEGESPKNAEASVKKKVLATTANKKVAQAVAKSKMKENKLEKKEKLKKRSKKCSDFDFDSKEDEFKGPSVEDSTLVEIPEVTDVPVVATSSTPVTLPEDDEDDDDDDDYDEPPLLVREDPYPEDDDEEFDSSKNNSLDLRYSPTKKLESKLDVDESAMKPLVPKRKPGRPRKDANTKAAVITQVYNTNRDTSYSDASKRAAVTVCKYTDDDRLKLDSPVPETPRVELLHDEVDVDEGVLEDRVHEDLLLSSQDMLKLKRHTHRDEVQLPAIIDEEDDDDDDIEQDVCIYYKNDDYQSSEEEKEDEAKAKKDYINRRHSELFGEIDDLDEEENNDRDTSRDYSDHHSQKSSKHNSKKREKDRKKHKHGDKHHHHHHHHHHKSKSKDGKHHHKKKDKKHSSDKENSRKVLKVEEVYDCSEEDPNSRDVVASPMEVPFDDESVQDVPEEGDVHDAHFCKEDDAGRVSVDVGSSESETSLLKKKKNKHKSKHHSKHHSKHKDGKSKDKESKNKMKLVKLKGSKSSEEKTKTPKLKTKENKKINKSSKNGKKKLSEKNVAAIDALSVATEQTLKDITFMLDAPGVARLSQEEELRETCQEEEGVYQPVETERQGAVLQLTADALMIEQEYRQRLKMDKVDRQKSGEVDDGVAKTLQHKKKKRKKDGETDVNINDGESKKKKLKTEHEEDDRNKKKIKIKSAKVKSDSTEKNDSNKVKSDSSLVKSDTELENKKVKPFLDKKSDSDKELDNGKELFKDIKDGRIKPGAIIKSKDIAKKEGVVKKEPKPPPEAKPKPKPNNPFGKINKQENSKLTTLIAKAKESRVGLVPNSEVGDSPKLSLGSIIVSGDIGTGIKSTHETDDDDKWEPSREREKWESSPWEGSNWDRPSEREEDTPIREEEPVKSEREEMEEVVVCERQQTPSSNESREDKTPTIEEIALPVTPRAPEIKQERATPNLSAWFKAFGAPKNSSSSSNNQNSGGSSQHGKQGDEDDDVDITELHSQEYPSDCSNFSRPESRQSRQNTPVHHQQQVQQRPSSQLQIHQSPGAGSLTDHLNSSMEQDQDDLDSTNSQQLLIGSCSGSMRDPMSSASRASSADRNHRTESNSDSAVDVVEVVGDDSNDSVHSGDHFSQPMLPSSPKPVGSPEPPLSPEPPMSPEPPLSLEKPPETPWYEKLDEKMEDEPIWRKNKMEEEEDPYKFEEEELDRAREEAKKLEVERQRKASVSSSGVSDRSPVPSLDNSPAAFSEGERSPAINSPVTPGFGGKQYSPVTEKSPNIPSYSPRYDANLNKPFSSSYDADKPKYQANGGLKVGFYKDHSEKSMIDKQDGKSSEHKPTESPLYSPTVPYVSNFYSKSDSSHNKQKSPGRYNSFYPPSIDPSVDKPKTPGYYPSSAPSTPSDKPSPNTMGSEGDKSKTPFNYYNYDPNKPLTDQFKGSGSSQSTPTHNSTPSRSTPSQNCEVVPPIQSNDMNSVNHNAVASHASHQSKHVPTSAHNQGLVDSSRQLKQPSYFGAPENNSDLSPSGLSPGSAALGLTSPNPMSIPSLPHHHQQQQQPTAPPPPPVQEKPLDLPPPKKRPGLDRVLDESNIHNRSLSMRSPIDISLFSQHSSPNLPANLANLSQIVSRFPEPQGSGFPLSDKDPMSLNLHHERHAPSCPPANHDKILHSPPVYGSTEPSTLLGISDLHTSSLLPGRRSQMDLPKGRELELQHPDRPASLAYHHQVTSPLMPPAQSPLGSSSSGTLHKHQSQSHSYNLSSQSTSQPPPPPAAHQKSLESERPGSRSVPPPPPNVEKSHHYLPPKTMWTSSSLAPTLPVSLSSSLASSFNSAAMAQFALAGQKGLGSLPPERLAQQLGMDRAALASLASRSNANIFPHELLGRSSSHQPQSQMSGGNSHSSSSGGSSSSHSNNGAGSTGGSSSRSASANNSVNTASNSNMDLTLARSYASLMSGAQSSPLFGRGDGTLTPRTLPGSTSPFLSQSPGLSSSLSMPGAPRTPTPAHQQPHQSLSLGQSNFGSSLPRDPISQSHPSLQIPSMNSIVSSQPQISHLNAAAGLASYHGRDSFSLMGQSSRGALVGAAGGLVDPAASQQLYQQYLQRQQEEFLLRSSHPQLAAQHSMMLQQGFMSAAAAGYPSGYPASLGLRSGSYQGMNRPWL